MLPVQIDPPLSEISCDNRYNVISKINIWLAHFVYFVRLVDFVCLVGFVHLVDLVPALNPTS